MSTFYDSPYTIWNDKTAGGMTPLPIVYLHSFRGNGEDVWKACHGLKDCPTIRYGAGRRAVAMAGGRGVEGPSAVQGTGGGASALDDGGVRSAGGGGSQQVHTGHTGQSGKWKFGHTQI